MRRVISGYRRQLNACDIEFVVKCLADDGEPAEAILALLADPSTGDALLDSPKLLATVLESVDTLLITPRLYFYLLARHAMKAAGIDEPEMADYVAGVLDLFSRCRPSGGAPRNFHVIDWMQRIGETPEEERFELYVRAGNQVLFLTGIFPDFLERRRVRRGAPGIGYYEQFGRQSYDAAARHPLGRITGEGPLFARIAGSFSDVRQALNELSERLVSIEQVPDTFRDPSRFHGSN